MMNALVYLPINNANNASHFFFLFVITNEGERHERATLHFSFLESIGTDSEHAHKADQTLGVSHFVAGDVVRYNVVVACETLALLPTE